MGPKQKKEIALIIGAVLIVVILGGVLTFQNQKNFAGAATTRISNLPDNPGVLSLLNEKCNVVRGNGACNSLCKGLTCVPLEDNCDRVVENNKCYCCASS
ncbi:MAG: hypothetical protein WCV90_02655 [Candidatus Woesearchaeota archaeon]